MNLKASETYGCPRGIFYWCTPQFLRVFLLQNVDVMITRELLKTLLIVLQVTVTVALYLQLRHGYRNGIKRNTNSTEM